MTDENIQPTTIEARLDTKYLLVVGVLMVLIMAALAALWLRERGRRIGAMRQVSELDSRLMANNNRLQELAQGLLAEHARKVDPIERGQWELRSVNLDGREVTAFEISPATARRIGGFKAGDVIIVAEEEGTAATSPAR
jgi:hypothetical protein